MHRAQMRRQFRRSLAWALCYVLGLYAFTAGFGTALAIAQGDGAASGFIICHNSAGDPPVTGDAGTPPPQAPCALCAVAVSAALPLHGETVLAVPLAQRLSIGFLDAVLSASLPFARAGLSRGPPSLA